MIINEEILNIENILIKLENIQSSFDYLKISIASPKRIKIWSERILPNGEIIGEVTKAETINFKTYKPETNGLFCEKIFGPLKNWECKCGKFKGFSLKRICDECFVELTDSRVRRYRMGYIELNYPIAHLWFFKGIPNYLTTILKCFNDKITSTHVEQIIYYKETDKSNLNPLYKVFFPNSKNIKLENFINSQIYLKKNGTELIKTLLDNLNLKNEIKLARAILEKNINSNIKNQFSEDKNLIKRIRILESFFSSKINPSWMILTILPILPPNLRPLFEMESGKLIASDLNEIYKLILTRNQRLFEFSNFVNIPDIILIHGRKLLQESIDSLIDNSRLQKDKILNVNNKPLKSLTEILEGKYGQFRQSLLGKRVDYSGRSVIIVGPTLRLNQCGLPFEMAIELFKPFIINELILQNKNIENSKTNKIKLSQIIIKNNKPLIWSILKNIIKKNTILLNRAPTLHKFGIQAFDPILVLEQAIHLHPLLCSGFNADFDGDQMAVHLPIYECSQLEVKTLMRPSFNIFSPSNGEVILKPSQDMVIGNYYLTLSQNHLASENLKFFKNEFEVLNSFYLKLINIHSPILVHYSLINFNIKIENNKMILIDNNIKLFEFDNQNVLIKNIFNFNNSKVYLLTNIGIFIGYKNNKNIYKITNFILETKPGRILFNKNFKNILKNI